MKEHFHSSLDKADLVLLMKRTDHPAMVRFVVMLILFLLTGWLAVLLWTGPLWQIIASQLAFGIMCCSTFACLHETAHGTAFKSRQWNRLAAFLSGIFHVYPSVAFKELHFTHHRYTHIPGKDPEISFGNHPLPSVISTLPSYLGWLTGLPFLLFKIMMIINGVLGMIEPIRKFIYPFVRPKVRFKLILESWVFIAVYGSIIYMALNIHVGFWALLVGQVVGHSLLASYLTAEHNGLPHEGHILEKTRSMKAPKLVKLLMWNMTYHAEHHAYPAVPFHRLPDLSATIDGELIHNDKTHPEFHTEVVRGLF